MSTIARFGFAVLLVAMGCNDGTDEESVAESPISGGVYVPATNYPASVHLYNHSTGLAEQNCGGVLIDEEWVLTAAHCMQVLTSDVDITYPPYDTASKQTIHYPYGPNWIFVNPGWFQNNTGQSPTFNDDIALVKLPTALASTPDHTPAQLPFTYGTAGQQGTVANGYQSGQINTYTGTIQERGALQAFTVLSSTQSLCSGDSGSGFITTGTGMPFVSGLASNTAIPNPPGCAALGTSFTATDIFAYMDWIHQTTQRYVGVDPSADLLWTSSSAWAIWSLIAGGYNGATSGPKDSAWFVTGAGDFNGDGTADILWRNTNGALLVWLMREGQNVGYVDLGQPDNWWVVKAVADVDGNGIADIVWQNSSSLEVNIWLFAQGVQYIGGGVIGTPPSSAWTIAGTGDFNHDGKQDLFWTLRNPPAVTQTSIWLLNGAAIAGYLTLSPATAVSSYSFKGIGHMNGTADSYRDDIVWKNSDGTVVFWNATGISNNVISFNVVSPGYATTEWDIKQVVDVTGDLISDLIWQRSYDRYIETWVINSNSGFSYGVDVGSAPSGWTLKAAAKFD